MQYQEAVAEARTLVKRSETDQWRLAQLTWEQVQSGITQTLWAQDVGVLAQTVSRWYRIWQYRLDHRADGASYAQTEAIVRGTVEGESLRQSESIKTVSNLPPKRKAEIVREALSDPDVARETFNAPEPDDETAAKARMHAGSAISRHDQRIQQHVQEKRHDESAAKGRTDQEALYEVSAMMQVLADVVVTGGKLARKLSEGATLPAGMRQTLAGYATKAKATIEWLEGIEDEQHAEDVDEVLRVWAAES